MVQGLGNVGYHAARFLQEGGAVIVGIALHTYDSMRRQIEQSYRVLREKEAMERELGIAREVQRELLPRSVPQVRGLQLAGACLPAVGVGGDLYDFLPFADELVGLVIADVSGKGIPAALLMAGLQASVRSIARPSLAPNEVMRRLNEVLLRSTSAARYATMFYCHYDGQPVIASEWADSGPFQPIVRDAPLSSWTMNQPSTVEKMPRRAQDRTGMSATPSGEGI